MTEATSRDPFLRAAGIGGLGFALGVLAENVLRAPPPQPHAPFAEVARYYVERHDLVAISDAIFVPTIPCLLIFAVGTARRLIAAHPGAAPWAIVGALAVSLMTATFGAVMALDVALLHLAPTLDEPLGRLLWTIKNAMFLVNVVPLAVGLGAFAIACAIANVGSRKIAVIGVGGGLLALVGTMPFSANLSGSPFIFLGLVGFLSWLTFVIATSISHLRAAAR